MPSPIVPTPVTRLLSGLAGKSSLRVGFVSDVHGQHKRPGLEMFVREAALDLLLSCGDQQDYRGGYPAPMLFIRGNHECWAVLREMDAGTRLPSGLAHLPDLTPVSIAGLRLVGLGGAWGTTPEHIRQHQFGADAVIRLHERRAEVVLSHDTPVRLHKGNRAGDELTVDLLREAALGMAPRFWFSGHHHHWETEQLGRTTLISLGRWPDEWATGIISGGRLESVARWVPRSDGYAKRKVRWQQDEQAEKSILLPLDRAGRRYGVTEPRVPAFR